MLRIAYCQMSAHPAYCGPDGNYCKEPFYGNDGPILTHVTGNPNVNRICGQIESLYNKKIEFKLQQLLHELEGKQIDIVVFPEYTIPAKCLPMLYEFCQREACYCIAASHSIQQSMKDTYEAIHMNIPIEDNINMSCCPIICSGKDTLCVFKRNKSKWEANMGTAEYKNADNLLTFMCKDQRITVLLCIDALHIDVDKKKTDILIVPAATPSDGSFKNKFESYLVKGIPTVFCNFCTYGNSTVYCAVPESSNLPYAESTHITKTASNEEVVVIIDVDPSAQITKTHSIISATPISVVNILPLLYRDDNAEQKTWGRIKEICEQKDYKKLEPFCGILSTTSAGIVAKKKNYICSGIQEQSIGISAIEAATNFVYVNDFTLRQYEVNWLEKTLQLITKGITTGNINFTDEIGKAFEQLSKIHQACLKTISEKIDIPVFDERAKDNSIFQNRGGEIQQFRNEQQYLNATIFVVQGFSQIGKSAFIDRVKQLYKFSTIDCLLPRSAGFESLLRWVCQVIGVPPEWESFDSAEIIVYAQRFAQYLTNLNKTIIVIRGTANLFDSYNQPKTEVFLCNLASELFNMNSGIKLIIENSRVLPQCFLKHPNIYICKLRPLLDMFIERLIEQTANNITYSFALPQILKSNIRSCKGNPAIARMVGICIGERLNCGEVGVVTPDEIDNFSDQYTEGILDSLKVLPDERELLSEATIYRIQVPEEAFKELPHYTENSFAILKDKLLFEESDNWFTVNSLVVDSLKKKIHEKTDLHRIAAQYFDAEYKQNPSYVAKAEYLYHASFYQSHPGVRENLKYYSNDILSAAIELINDGAIEIGRSHLDSIRFFTNVYSLSEYNFYYAFCCIMNDEYELYRDKFQESVSEAGDKKDVVYYRMINKLLRERKLNEVENLLNEVCDQYPHTRQMDALWIDYWYSNKQTRSYAIAEALKLTKASAGDFYSAKTLVRLYLNENMTDEAIKEIDAVLAVWHSNKWANKMHRFVLSGNYKIQSEEEEDEDSFNIEE